MCREFIYSTCKRHVRKVFTQMCFQSGMYPSIWIHAVNLRTSNFKRCSFLNKGFLSRNFSKSYKKCPRVSVFFRTVGSEHKISFLGSQKGIYVHKMMWTMDVVKTRKTNRVTRYTFLHTGRCQKPVSKWQFCTGIEVRT